MGERDDDGLGLSLSLTLSQPSLKPNLPPLMTSSSSSSPPPPHLIHKIHDNNWPHLFQSSERNGDVGRFFRRGFDVNKAPASVTVVEVEEDGEGGVSSPKSTVSSVISGNKRSERDLAPVNDGERASCSHGGGSDDEDGGGNGGDGSRKKLRLSKEQGLVLEETFKEHTTLNPKQKVTLAKQLNLRPRQVEVWFQNRRARTKLKQTEVDCEYLKRCCDNLTEENRRLQKEVIELRALKLSPHLYMHMTPPTTLTMCPSCERLAVSSAANVNPTVRRPSPQRPGPGSPWTGISLQSRPGH